MKKYLLFDLDGTLTDPSSGITNCIAYALDRLNIPCPPAESLKKYIGPPLYQSFMELLGTDDRSAGENAVKIYRERFSTIGLFENYPYENIPAALSGLKDGGYKMFVCTSKPQIFAEKIIDHFGMGPFFEKVFGSSLDGTHVEKDSLIAHLLSSEKLAAADCAMIGDRIYDIDGAVKNGVAPYGVSYGFGECAEFAQAEKIFDCPLEISDYFLR